MAMKHDLRAAHPANDNTVASVSAPSINAVLQ
jgi:hypothetical protein